MSKDEKDGRDLKNVCFDRFGLPIVPPGISVPMPPVKPPAEKNFAERLTALENSVKSLAERLNNMEEQGG